MAVDDGSTGGIVEEVEHKERQERRKTPARSALVLAAVNLAWPGTLTPDGSNQLQAMIGASDDSHPPIVAAIRALLGGGSQPCSLFGRFALARLSGHSPKH